MSKGFVLHEFVDLLGNDAAAVAACVASLRTEGWALVRLPRVVAKDAADVAKQLEGFFGRDAATKSGFNISKLLGYNAVRGLAPDGSDGPVFKEKLTFVTTQLDKAPVAALQAFIKHTDVLVTDLCLSLAGSAHAAVRERIPLARGDFGLFDVALYGNGTRENVPKDMNVASHVDPGLLAVSWYSNRVGLEVFSQTTQRFVPVPAEPGVGVIWAGQAAQELLGFTPGVHRVQYSDGPRLTFWTEACVPEQLTPSGIPAVFLELDQKVPKNKYGLKTHTFGDGPRKKNVEVGEKLGGTMEQLLGVPMMKTISYEVKTSDGSCAVCSKEGFYGKGLIVHCFQCDAVLCNSKCSALHKCPVPAPPPPSGRSASPNRPPSLKMVSEIDDDEEESMRGESLGGNMERLLGIPTMKSGEIPTDKCAACNKEGEHGSALTVICKCGAVFCQLECSASHTCPVSAPSYAPSPDVGLNRAPAPKRLSKKYEVAEIRGESLGGDMERLLGIPGMKSGMIPTGNCAWCTKKGEYGSVLKVTCSKCRAVFCELECGAKHRCPGPQKIELLPAPARNPFGSSRGESLGGDMERLLGVPSMKSGRMPTGSCSVCQKSGQHGKALTVKCSKCKDIFCNTTCCEKHECPKAGGILSGLFKKRSPSPARHSSSNSNKK